MLDGKDKVYLDSLESARYLVGSIYTFVNKTLYKYINKTIILYLNETFYNYKNITNINEIINYVNKTRIVI